MFGLGVALLIMGYGFSYTGVMNLINGGKGPTLFQAFGVTKTLASPADYRPAQGSSNQVGTPATTATTTPAQKTVWT